MNNKCVLFATLLVCMFSTTSSIAEEIDYIPTPNVIQIADLNDDDNDGVINARDLCLQTPTGAEVDNDGCEAYVESEEIYQLKILFNNDSDKIERGFEQQIEGLASFLEIYASTSVEIQGYASKVGRAAHNLELSIRRANSVRDTLIRFGIDAQRVKIIGYGDTVLNRTGTDEATHAGNRRVTAAVVGHKGNVKDEWTIFTTIPKQD
ncbi:OmpA family protein [Vibrio tapetis subsp. quintayensis]|uniref:OmpA family protein n=1 Tax=Vibrio tapetis TaxID=52443 RepID=UPI0025B3B98D|nr:OmpA family protein [Vibrio tapetis]MDN3681111.1 OmpA family protein [Vibrio tapetis subsp. quintayensis]